MVYRHLDEVAARQRDMERLAEEKLAARQREREQEPTRTSTEPEWRRRERERERETGAASGVTSAATPGKYVPPALGGGAWRSRRTEERRAEEQPVSSSPSTTPAGAWRRSAAREPERDTPRQFERVREENRDPGEATWRRGDSDDRDRSDRTVSSQEERRAPVRIGGAEGGSGWRSRMAAREAERATSAAGESDTGEEDGFTTVKRPLKRR